MCKLLLNHCGESKSMRKEFKKYKPEVDLLVIHLVVHQNENIHPWLVRHEYKNQSSTESLVLIDTAEVLLVNADEVIWIFSWLMKTLLIFNLPFHDLFVYLFFAVSFGSRILSAFPVTHQPFKKSESTRFMLNVKISLKFEVKFVISWLRSLIRIWTSVILLFLGLYCYSSLGECLKKDVTPNSILILISG